MGSKYIGIEALKNRIYKIMQFKSDFYKSKRKWPYKVLALGECVGSLRSLLYFGSVEVYIQGL